jgi:hypothetical protein
MAIIADLIGSPGLVQTGRGPAPVMELPANKVQRIGAAGVYDLTNAGSNIFEIRLGLLSDPIYFRVNLDTDNTNAGVGDDKSIHLEAGQNFSFGLPNASDASAYKIDVRAG